MIRIVWKINKMKLPNPDSVVYFVCEDVDVPKVIEHLIHKYDLYYKPIRILDRPGDATKIRGIREVFIYLHNNICSDELKYEIENRAVRPIVIY